MKYSSFQGNIPLLFLILLCVKLHESQSVISVMMIITSILEQMLFHFEEAMGHCNGKTEREMTN